MKYVVILLLTLGGLISSQLYAQKYFISFTDKGHNSYTISSPNDFLSERSIERREKQGILITEQDLPVSAFYLDSLRHLGLKTSWTSKWLNGVIVETNDQTLLDTIINISFVSGVRQIKPNLITATFNKFISKRSEAKGNLKSSTGYGFTWDQTQTVNGQYLHQNNYEGQGMVIAILDAGFNNVNTLSCFQNIRDEGRLLSYRDIVNPDEEQYIGDSHGTHVFSIIGGFQQATFKGSAPEASFHLVLTEDVDSEYPIEEYNWVIGAEYADSIGADVINSSLGYYLFDGVFSDYSYADMDGASTVVVFGAETAVEKGMIVVNSAGNEGNNSWNKIISPADGEQVLAVAAMSADSLRASFSSFGPSYDGRVKPDVSGVGSLTAYQTTSGIYERGYGTSYSAPVITGFVSCLWQANPTLKNTEILDLVKESCNQNENPDYSFGYGIPDFKKALSSSTQIDTERVEKIKVFPNPFYNSIHVKSHEIIQECNLVGLNGYSYYSADIKNESEVTLENLSDLPAGVYLLRLKTSHSISVQKLVKN